MKRADFRKKIEAELTRMGFEADTWIWRPNPARLTICIGGKFRDIPIKANMRKDVLAFELGRLQGWADMLGIAKEASVVAPKPRRPRQIDLEEAIAGAPA